MTESTGLVAKRSNFRCVLDATLLLTVSSAAMPFHGGRSHTFNLEFRRLPRLDGNADDAGNSNPR